MRQSIGLYIPCYNGVKYLAALWKALQGQTLRPAKILLVDDGSRDGSGEVAGKLGFEVLSHGENRGLSCSRNSAIRTLQNPLIAALDVDCLPEPGWLKLLVDGLGEGLAGVGGRLLESHSDTLADRWRATHMAQDHGKDSREDVRFLFGSNTLWRRQVLLDVQGYTESLRTNGEDVDLCRRLRVNGKRFGYVAEAVCWHQRRDTLTSVLRTYHRWGRPERRIKAGWHAPIGLLQPVAYGVWFALKDLVRLRWRLLPLDLWMPVDFLAQDFLDWRARRRAP